MSFHRMPILNIFVTRSTKNQRFTASGRHDFDPVRFFSARVAVQIFECSNVVGSGAGVPLQGSSVTRPQNRACTFRCTRLALYVLLEMLFGRRAYLHEADDDRCDRGRVFFCGGLPSCAAKALFLLLHLSVFAHDAPQMALPSFHSTRIASC